MASDFFTGRLSADDSLRQSLDEIFYNVFGRVIVRKAASAPDPLTQSGFLQWEGALIADLRDGTAGDRDQAVIDTHELIRQTPVRQSPEAYRDAILQGLIPILIALQQGALIVSGPLTRERSEAMAASTLDAWALAQVGKARNLTSTELNALQELSRNHGYFASHFFGHTLFTRAQDRLAAHVTRGEPVIAIAEALPEELGSLFSASVGYWDPYATAVLNHARSYATLEQFVDGGVQYLTYYNPLDERTTAFCRDIAGTRVSVRSARAHMSRIVNAQSMDELLQIDPFVSSRKDDEGEWIYTVDDQDFTADEITPELLGQLGKLTPPFHNRCRTLMIPD